ncbi:ABC transporter permease [Paenibacillus flagellatus]|uniref:ABC transporter permease n=1 Tax=Paenibacillus flagellatus TaxID=2211139 RepID=A0A2V5K1D3_9BACL|nr:ABC transporter permease [Paenibacillus flagellatus]PYI52901.1 hypothetical protein DLM86_18000 [Paenibacillus flagellatus]
MLNLITNENMKIYRRLRTWILVALLVGISVTAAILVYKLGAKPQPGADWRAEVAQSIEQDKQSMADVGMDSVKREMEKRIQLQEYRLAHDIPPGDRTLWSGVLNASSLIALVTIFTVIVAGEIVAGEFTWGTIKLLLIRPASRSKILLSKYVATLLFSLLLLVFLFGSAFAANAFLYGFGGVGHPYLYVDASGAVVESSMLLHVLGTFGLQCVELIMTVTLAFMISTVFRSSSLSIGISMFLMFAGSGIAMMLSRFSWGKYFLFANTNLTPYIEGQAMMEGMTLPFSIGVLLVYFVAFNVCSWLIFNKRDVAA